MSEPLETESELRMRLLESQVEHLSGELELMKKRYAADVYNVAWHIGWPVRLVENFIRRRRIKNIAPSPAIHAPPIETVAPNASEIALRILSLRN